MNIFYRAYCRTYQLIMRLSAPLLPWHTPEILSGKDANKTLAKKLLDNNIDRVLIVCGRNTYRLGLLDPLISTLQTANIHPIIYNNVAPDPTIDCIERGVIAYHDGNCQAIIAFGGGSPMDAAKIIGARAAKPKKTVAKMRGLLKINKKLPPLIAIPTTSGTGSECTIAAVITNECTEEKYPITDPCLTPRYALLDPQLTISLPPHTTAITGIDALTHAVEAYIGRSNTSATKDAAIKAVKLIFDNLPTAYEDGNDINARKNMQLASYYAGIAFTRAYVGYAHALAHQLGGKYHTAHGLANAILLPHVLRAYGKSAHKSLAQLATAIGLQGENNAVLAERFINKICKLNSYCDIPCYVENLKAEDIPILSQRASREGNPLYPVPRLMDKNELASIYRSVMKNR